MYKKPGDSVRNFSSRGQPIDRLLAVVVRILELIHGCLIDNAVMTKRLAKCLLVLSRW